MVGRSVVERAQKSPVSEGGYFFLLLPDYRENIRLCNLSTLCHVMMHSTKCEQVIVVKSPAEVLSQWYCMMHADVIILNPPPCPLEIPDASLTAVVVSLSDLVALACPRMR